MNLIDYKELICNLRVVDMQNDFVIGSLGTAEARGIVQKIKEKIEQECDNGSYIFFTQDTHYEDYLNTKEGEKLPVPHCIRNTDGWNIVNELITNKVKEHGYSCVMKNTFGYEFWYSHLNGLRGNALLEPFEIELVGVCTDICVISNALILKSLFREDTIKVDASCCAGTTPEKHKMAIEVMKSCQIDITNGG